MKNPFISTLVVFFMVFSLVLSIPAVSIGGCGGGGGSGRQQGDSSDDPGLPGSVSVKSGFGFIDPSPLGELGIANGTVDINNIPEFKPLTPREKKEMEQRINQADAAFWSSLGQAAEISEGVSKVAAGAGKVAGWGLAFTPVGLPVKIAIVTARGAADGYAASLEKGSGDEASRAALSGAAAGVAEGLTSSVNPVVGIVAGEVVGSLSTSDVSNRAPEPNIGDMAMQDAKITHDPVTGRALTAPVYR
ncbi:MAG: hypothetical protein M0Q23_07135 [Syntrophales bacterium]|nr:hypothetical protein [Syntrophales bacterium]MCK9528397.1 hypothetical protein [Syntrophales bacterium]MDX9922678.1 hypothetical protein [Syntrophales bacterium]